MPIIQHSDYSPPWWCRNSHLQSIYPSILRASPTLDFQTKRFATPDNDFFDVDWVTTGSRKLMLALHGLEGSSKRPYIQWLMQLFSKNGFDSAGLNFRGCSGEPNLTIRKYHSGDTADLHQLIQHIEQENLYDEIYLFGVSLGGNVVLKYLGDNLFTVSNLIKRAVTFSVPTELKECVHHLAKWHNRHYTYVFINDLFRKLAQKKELYDKVIDFKKLKLNMTLVEYDHLVTAKIHGFKNGDDYYQKNSCGQFLGKIKTPTLIVNAKNDPFLTKNCYPKDIAEKSKFLYLETPKYGGHLGFVTNNPDGYYWSELRTLQFCTTTL